MNLRIDIKVLSSQEAGLILQMKIKYLKVHAILAWNFKLMGGKTHSKIGQAPSLW